MRKIRLISLTSVVVVTAGLSMAATTAQASTVQASTVQASTARRPALPDFLRQTMDELKFQEVLDLAPRTASAYTVRTVDKDAIARRSAASASARPISQQPQINATVLELDDAGRVIGSALVLMSPQYPHGQIVPLDGDLHTTDVRWRQWDDAGWYTNHAQGTIDVVPGRENAAYDFMLPYPASTLKLMVNFGVLRLVDQGVISLDDTYQYQPTAISSLCGNASSNTIRGYIDASLTQSSNAASCALIKMLWDHDAIDGLNQQFRALGLETLQLKGTNPANGGHWANDITMSSLDAAKLLTIVNGGTGTLWTAPDGTAVTRDVLSAASRTLFLSELNQQGWNWMLSTTNFCGAAYPAAGIPQLTADRWIGPDGTMNVAGNQFGQDVRPCNADAEVTFAHKTGWVNNTGADVGIVSNRPGFAKRHYVISVISNLGDQYQDPGRPATPSGTTPVEYTQKFAQLGAAVDRYEACE